MADRHAEGAKSKYTTDRGMPGAFEGETVSRRRFMELVTHGAGGVAAAAFTLPALGFAISPLFSREPFNWQPIGYPDDFTEDAYQTKVVTLVQGIGDAGNSIAYVRKRNPAIDTQKAGPYNQYVALSSRCMHLGCPVRYIPAAERFVCPCHGGVYDYTGEPVSGPPVRPLNRFYTRVHNGLVELGPWYSVNFELHMFSPRMPAQPLNGIGQYLYPKQFDNSILPGS